MIDRTVLKKVLAYGRATFVEKIFRDFDDTLYRVYAVPVFDTARPVIVATFKSTRELRMFLKTSNVKRIPRTIKHA